MGMSVTERNLVQDYRYQGGARATVYFALFNNGAEIVDASYARVAVTCNDVNFPDAANGLISNGTRIEFGPFTAPVTVDEIRVYSAAAAGTLLESKALAADVTSSEFYLEAGDWDSVVNSGD